MNGESPAAIGATTRPTSSGPAASDALEDDMSTTEYALSANVLLASYSSIVEPSQDERRSGGTVGLIRCSLGFAHDPIRS